MKRYEKALLELLPKWVFEEIANMNISNSDKLNKFIMIQCHLPEEDRKSFEEAIIKLKPAFIGKH